ncbi:hypothetical protein H6F89_34255 [Cyanobacteria bacterium FACHB-63]|nr:hypothetical protein [Cyanobacteria bacterium FACHB-63]
MSAQIIYKQILSLELWHDYYLGQLDPPILPTDYDISNLLTLAPTSECLGVLKRLRWIFRSQTHGAAVFANVDKTASGDFQTKLPISQSEQLTFWLVVRDRYFANFTNLLLSPLQNYIYYFSNLSNKQGHALFLTQPLSQYTANTEYALGKLVTRGGSTLEALTYKASASSTPSNKDWETLPSSQYVSDLDRLPYQALSRTQVIPNLNPGDAFRLTLINANGQETFVFEATAPNHHSAGTSISVNLNFSGQTPGRYQLHLNGKQIDAFILADPVTAQKAFGLVEIVLRSDLLSSDFALLEASAGQTLIRPKTYVIRFKNRATCWRYRYEKPHGFNAADLPDFDVLDDKTYATKRPLGLRLQPATPLKDGKDYPLPFPDVGLIKPETDTFQHVTAIFSDIHL